MDSLEEIKSKLDIVSFISESVNLTRSGRNFKAPCPFHKEKIASFIVSPELQLWHCFGACNEGGDIFKFLMKMEGMDFGEALREMAKRTGVKLASISATQVSEKEQLYKVNYEIAKFYHYALTGHEVGQNALYYLQHVRGLNMETIKTFGLGFGPDNSNLLTQFLLNKRQFSRLDVLKSGVMIESNGKLVDRFRNRLVFPLRDSQSNVVGFSGRILPKDENKDLAKYVNTPETLVYQKRRHLFGIDITHRAIKEAGYVVVVEGEFDLLSIWQAGLPAQAGIRNIVAIKGTAFTADQARLLVRFTSEAVFALDSDSAGEHATKLGILIAQEQGLNVKVASLGSFKDPDEAVRSDVVKFKQRLETAVPAYDFFIDSAFTKFSATTAGGVAAISKELSPIIAGISDKIVQAHYIRVLAERLRINDEAVAAQIEGLVKRNSLSLPALPAQAGQAGLSGEGQKEVGKSRRELIEEQLVSLSLQRDPSLLTNDSLNELLQTPILKRIKEELKKFIQDHHKFTPRQFLESLPAELKDETASLLLVEVANEDKAKGEFDHLCDEIATIDLNSQIEQVTSLMKAKEQKSESLSVEQAELARLVIALSVIRKRNLSI
ncbi:DNA primase [Candidatus Microgenomates bacterium]|nr:DNA primase [Candidatus Microgenomates bacterium]